MPPSLRDNLTHSRGRWHSGFVRQDVSEILAGGTPGGSPGSREPGGRPVMAAKVYTPAPAGAPWTPGPAPRREARALVTAAAPEGGRGGPGGRNPAAPAGRGLGGLH